jgi:hypothetical protein
MSLHHLHFEQIQAELEALQGAHGRILSQQQRLQERQQILSLLLLGSIEGADGG